MSEIDKKKESFNNIAWKYVKDPVILRVKRNCIIYLIVKKTNLRCSR